jgi:hypothetical protein
MVFALHLIVTWSADKGLTMKGALEIVLRFLLIAIPIGWAAVRLWIGPDS